MSILNHWFDFKPIEPATYFTIQFGCGIDCLALARELAACGIPGPLVCFASPWDKTTVENGTAEETTATTKALECLMASAVLQRRLQAAPNSSGKLPTAGDK